MEPMRFAKVSIDQLDDEGLVMYEFEVEEHFKCRPGSCSSRAYCESCGRNSDTDVILVGQTYVGMDFFSCYPCVDVDDYVRVKPIEGIERAEPILLPEEGMYQYPHTTSDGRAIDSRGYVEA